MINENVIEKLSQATGGELGDDTSHGTANRITYARLADDAGFIRSQAEIISADARDSHRSLLIKEWQKQTANHAKTSISTMLEKIADFGFSWNDIASLCSVSILALRKWRRGGNATGENRNRLASLIAVCDIIGDHFMVEEPASWFETPLPGVPVTPFDMYRANRVDLVLEYASSRMETQAVLDEFDPEWRERYETPFEVVTAWDGLKSIQPKR